MYKKKSNIISEIDLKTLPAVITSKAASVILMIYAAMFSNWSRDRHMTGQYTECSTRYRTRHFFNNSNTNEDIAAKFEQEYVRCVKNDEECVCSVCL
jgi:hypothetical protein